MCHCHLESIDTGPLADREQAEKGIRDLETHMANSSTERAINMLILKPFRHIPRFRELMKQILGDKSPI